jgi:hypothetical protein
LRDEDTDVQTRIIQFVVKIPVQVRPSKPYCASCLRSLDKDYVHVGPTVELFSKANSAVCRSEAASAFSACAVGTCSAAPARDCVAIGTEWPFGTVARQISLLSPHMRARSLLLLVYPATAEVSLRRGEG